MLNKTSGVESNTTEPASHHNDRINRADRLRKRKFWRRRATALLLVLGVGYIIFALSAPLPALRIEGAISASFVKASPATPAWPEPTTGASAALGVLNKDQILTSSTDDMPRPMASITKVVTTLVVLEAQPITGDEAGPAIAFSDKDSSIRDRIAGENGSTLPVFPGRSLSERELLTGVLVASANNYAEQIAVWAYGSVEDYLTAAQEWLVKNGLTSIQVVDPTGLDPQNVASPGDLIRLAKIALENPVVSELVSLETASIPLVGTIEATNTLLGRDGFRGVKTGTLDESGYCLLFARDLSIDGESVTVVGVVMGAESRGIRDDLALQLGLSLDDNLVREEVIGERNKVAALTSAWDETVDVVTEASVSTILWNGEGVTTSYDLTGPHRTVTRGEEVGVATTAPSTAPVRLITTDEITAPGFGWRLSHPFDLLSGLWNRG
ncbi:hypothetical protein [Lysinibacter sp. HNR]|uniref:D-alanyl-D-alanine carboxypeptidase family protein n=1 Tax=Lysinibacter sp. HNR TaxID=3031408 RepID=UPI002436081D|nr:hypothetical protein [Lysinibacter sp. HNR]WGD36210.1 hypothetical protein FrondiHNR_06865 [Lysinibacter sp. HNR]